MKSTLTSYKGGKANISIFLILYVYELIKFTIVDTTTLSENIIFLLGRALLIITIFHSIYNVIVWNMAITYRIRENYIDVVNQKMIDVNDFQGHYISFTLHQWFYNYNRTRCGNVFVCALILGTLHRVTYQSSYCVREVHVPGYFTLR